MKKYTNNLPYYGLDIDKIKQLTLRDEKKLSKQIKLGDIIARNKLVSANLKLVLSIAHKYKDKGIEFSELVAEGNKWLITAADRFEGKKGFNFSTFAYWWIRQSMILLIKEKSKREEITTELILDENEDVEKFLIGEMSLGNAQMHSYYEDKEIETEQEVTENLFNDVILHLNKLTEKESEIIKHYYGICDKKELNIGEISKKYKITSMSVSNIIESSIKKVRCAILENN